MVCTFLRVPFPRCTNLMSVLLGAAFEIEYTFVLALAPAANGPSASTAKASTSSPSGRIGCRTESVTKTLLIGWMRTTLTRRADRSKLSVTALSRRQSALALRSDRRRVADEGQTAVLLDAVLVDLAVRGEDPRLEHVQELAVAAERLVGPRELLPVRPGQAQGGQESARHEAVTRDRRRRTAAGVHDVRELSAV